MQRVQLPEIVRQTVGKAIGIGFRETTFSLQFCEDSSCFILDEARLRELATVLVDGNATDLTSPIVDILKKPEMEKTVIFEIERSPEYELRQLDFATKRMASLTPAKLGRIADTGIIDEAIGAQDEVRVGE